MAINLEMILNEFSSEIESKQDVVINLYNKNLINDTKKNN